MIAMFILEIKMIQWGDDHKMKPPYFNIRIAVSSLFAFIVMVAISTDLFAQSAVIEDENELFGHSAFMDAATVSDQSLAEISGLGLQTQKLITNDQLSVILWDEINKGKHQQPVTSAEGNNNVQSVNLNITGY